MGDLITDVLIYKQTHRQLNPIMTSFLQSFSQKQRGSSNESEAAKLESLWFRYKTDCAVGDGWTVCVWGGRLRKPLCG